MSLFKAAAQRLLVKRASLEIVDTFIDKVASTMPVTKRAAFRLLQAGLSSGATLAQAIKVAFPQLSGEERGIFAANLCKSAADDAKTRTPESYTVPAQKGAKLMREKCSANDPVEGALNMAQNINPPRFPSFPNLAGMSESTNNAANALSLGKLRATDEGRNALSSILSGVGNVGRTFGNKALQGLNLNYHPSTGFSKRSSLTSRGDSPLLGSPKDTPLDPSTAEFKGNLRQREIGNRMADATAPMQDDFDRPTDSSLAADAADNALVGKIRDNVTAYKDRQDRLTKNVNDRISSVVSGARNAVSGAVDQARAFGDKLNILGLGKTRDPQNAAAPDTAAPAKDGILSQLESYARAHPGSLGLGAAGLGAGALGTYGLYKMLQNRKKKNTPSV